MSNLSPFEFALRQATRTSVKPLICLYSPSGCGKTYSALLLARGMVGDAGKIGLADSEAGRGSLYADIIPGGYQTLAINEPFSPRKYLECMMFMERQKLDIGIIDSGSHEWEGLGGVLEMAHEREVKSGKTGLHVWKEPKMEHQKWVQHFLQSPIPWIICLRAKHKSRQTKNAQGKTEIVRDDDASPIQAEDFIFEMTAHMEILPNHAIKLTKCSHPDLRRCFPKDNTEPLTIETGRKIKAWCDGASTATEAPELRKAKKQLWEMTKARHGGVASALEAWLLAQNIITDTETLEGMTIDRVKQVTDAAVKNLTNK